ncbi:23S rRNA (adenine-N6)-dimethyltransferase [Nocardia transvalensis]|uniref:23S rRNA (Adenine-N6)-dimethyltransferase n=1 Tax=Nocardia transvalensis TaxID=37333 RepID=A0A7W9PE54_9NOCA|nr:23S ribosomal RNA methyltransferase Erm [Nocardia transvalensis]MBB5914467.1 23S rRNA (adenine-N6)-dimethyltransferase [Nocardia transvalensis]
MSRSLSRAPGPRKTLSQNFLIDARAAATIVRTSGIAPDDLVLEVGPGDGMLTRHILAAGGRVLAYEKDPRYAGLLRRRYASNDRIRLYHRDFRTVRPPREPFAVVANIPFGITTDIVRWCLAARHLSAATLVTQREFARKHSGGYGRWSKLTVDHWPWVSMTLGATITRTSFHPIPQVDAAVLHLRRRAAPLLPRTAADGYRHLVALGFSGVGGSVAASLRREYPARAVRKACAAAGVAADEPVGFVPPEAWIVLYRVLAG